MSFHFFLSATNSLHLLTSSTWRSLSTSSFHLFLGLPFLLVPSSSWVKIFLGILSSSILPRCPNQLILCPFIHFTIFYPLLISSSSRFVLLFHSPFSYLGPYILLNIFLLKISRAFSSFFVNVHSHVSYMFQTSLVHPQGSSCICSMVCSTCISVSSLVGSLEHAPLPTRLLTTIHVKHTILHAQPSPWRWTHEVRNM